MVPTITSPINVNTPYYGLVSILVIVVTGGVTGVVLLQILTPDT